MSIFSKKNVGPKNRRTNVRKYVSRKCPKSISLDSGHLDKPFGPLIFKIFQYFLNKMLDRFFGLFFWFGDPLDPLTCISLREGVIDVRSTAADPDRICYLVATLATSASLGAALLLYCYPG